MPGKVFFVLLIYIFCLTPTAYVQAAVDSDGDGLSDEAELTQYFTDPQKWDTDGDGFSDGEEVANHYSPHQPDSSLSQTDLDKDGLSDWQELQFGTDMSRADTDSDGFSDFAEIQKGFDPLSAEPKKLPQKIVIDRKSQTLTAYLKDIPLAIWPVSTGKAGYETPAGTYTVNNKVPRAWSRTYGLWMPYWMSFIGSQYGIHELPEWPGGLKEGANHLGIPVSHGCVRLGVGPAQWLYNWADVGTTVVVQ